MEFRLISKLDKKYQVEIIPCFEECEIFKYGDILNKLKKQKLFEGKKGTNYSFNKNDEDEILKIIFMGLGKKSELTYDSFYKSVVSIFEEIKTNLVGDVLFHSIESTNLDDRNMLKAIVLACNACCYKFDKYITKKSDDSKFNIYIYTNKNEGLDELLNIKDAINLTRDLVNEPSNFLTPEEFGNRCIEQVKDLNIDIDVYDENWIKQNNLKALYEVGKASVNKPRFIVMKYFGGNEKDKVISFVGKGLTYDSGGYSIKSSDGMVTMKCDMAGAASVLSLITLVAKQNLKVNIFGVIPTCENMINGNGFKPGDVIGSLSGKTIEVISTDAEGRLVLADGVYYAAKNLNSDLIIDIATLTGACGIALGTKYAAVIDNDENIFDELNNASKNTVDSIWRLPADKEYLSLLKSDVADYKNIGGRYGGTITAGLFIGEFVSNKPWAHIDIAYVAWNDFSTKILPKKGATGAIVELLYNFCKNNENA